MKTPMDRRDIDPSVTDEEVERALDGDPAPFPEVDAQDDPDVVSEAKALLGVIPQTPHQAIGNARGLREQHTWVGVGMCLATVRGPIFGVPALWPDAQAAMDHSAPFHKTTDPLKPPRGSVGFASNGGHGHVWLNLGGGLCSTTDFHENGFEGVALIARVLDWCNAHEWGWGETLNGFDVWPDPVKPKPKPKPWGLPEREREIRRALHRATIHDAPQRRIDGLRTWDEKLRTRMAEHNLDPLPL